MGKKSQAKIFLMFSIVLIVLFTIMTSITLSQAQEGSVSFGPEKIEFEPIIIGDGWSKKVYVNRRNSESYENVFVTASIPESLRDVEFYIVLNSGSFKRLTDNPKYSFDLIDSDGNGRYDKVSWVIPELDEDIFLIEGGLTEPVKPTAQPVTTLPTTTTVPELSYREEIESVGDIEIGKQVTWRKRVITTDDVPNYALPDQAVIVKIDEERNGQDVIFDFEFKTPAPYKEEIILEGFEKGGGFRKRVEVKSDYNEHYMNVKSYTDLPEEIFENGYGIKLYHLVGNSRIDVTKNEKYNVRLVDFDSNGITDRVEWIVPQLSNQTFEVEADLTVINVQSYPTLYGNWTVMFNTTGTSNLTISAVDGTQFGWDIEFLQLRCGDDILTDELTDGVVFVENYSCNETGYEISKVLIAGKHTLKFQFGDDVEYAYNDVEPEDFEDWEAYSDTDTDFTSSVWKNIGGDDCDWIADSAGTGSSNTGPGCDSSTGYDHTIGDTSGMYAYLETSSGYCMGDGLYAELNFTDELDADTYKYNISFWAHMYGSTMGELYLDVWNGSWTNGYWSQEGNNIASCEDPYQYYEVDLSEFDGTIYLRFRGVSGGNYYGDIAIDDINITRELLNEAPTDPNNITCNSGNNCNISVNNEVTLAGTGSTDNDDDEITYFLEAALENETVITNGTDVSMAGSVDGGSGEIEKASTDATGTGTSATLQFSHTLVSGTNRMIICAAGAEFNGDGDIATPTYGGQTMTQAVMEETGTSGYIYEVRIFYLLEEDLPSEGSNQFSISISQSANLEFNAWCGQFNGVNQGVPEATDTVTASSGTVMTNTISPSDDAWVISAPGVGNAGTFTHGQNQQETYDANDGSSGFATAELRGADGETSLSSTFSGTINRGVRLASSFAPATGETTSNETNTSYTTYEDVDSDYKIVENIAVKVEVDSYDPRASVDQGTGDPDLSLEIWNSTDWIVIDDFSINESYVGNLLNTTNENFTLTITESTILTVWENSTNQDLRIKGKYMDHNSTLADQINYTNIWVTINGKGWSMIGNHTNGTNYSWNTTDIDEQTCVDLRTRAIDLDGSNTYSDYFTKGCCLNISHNALPTLGNLKENPADPATYSPGKDYYFNITIDDQNGVSDIDTVLFSWDGGSNETVSTCSNINTTAKECQVTKSDLPVQSNTPYNWYANDTVGVWTNQSGTYSITRNSSSNYLHLKLNTTTTDDNRTYTYPEAVNATGSKDLDEGSLTLYRNGISVGTEENILLGNGTYNYTLYYAQTENYTSGSIEYYTFVNKGTVQPILSITPAGWTHTYPTQTEVSCSVTSLNDEVSCDLYRNDTGEVTSPDQILLGAGGYEYKTNISGTGNYSVNSTGWSEILNIQQNQTNPVKFYFRNATGEYLNQNMSIIYETQSNATGVVIYSNSGSLNLYRDGVDVTTENSQNVLIGGGVHEYKANITGNQNYSSNATGETHYLIVSKKQTSTHLWINGTRDDSGFTQNDNANFTVELTGYPGKPVELWTNYSNGVWKMWDSGNSPLENFTQMSTIGTFEFKGNYSDNENYTSSEESWFAIVSLLQMKSKIESLSPTSINQSQNSTIVGNCSCTGGICNNVFMTIVEDGSVISSSPGGNLQVNGSSSYSLGNLEDAWATRSWKITGWVPGTYSIRVRCNSSETGNMFSTTQNLKVNDTEMPRWSGNVTSPASGSEYLEGRQYRFNVSWTDNKQLGTVLIEHNFTGSSVPHNETLTTSDGSVYYFTVNNLPAGTYVWKMYSNDSSDNWNSTDQWIYVVAKNVSTSMIHLYLNGSEDNNTYTYPEAVNASGSKDFDEGTVTLYRDSVSVGTEENIILGNGTYNYTLYYPATQNYSSASVTRWVFVNKANSTPYLSLFLNGTENNITRTYPEAVNATGYKSFSEGSLTLYRDGASVGTEENILLGNGTYNYTLYYAQTENYSSGSRTRWVFVNKADSSSYLKLALNGTEGDQAFNYPQAVNATGWATLADNQDLTFTLYRDYASTGQSGDPSTEEILLGNGTYVYEYNTTSGENYTSGSITRTYKVLKGTIQPSLSITPAGWTHTYPTTTNVSCSVTSLNDEVSCDLYRNDSSVGATFENILLGAGGYEYKTNISGTGNYSVNATGWTEILEIQQNTSTSNFMNLTLGTGTLVTESNYQDTYPATTNATGWYNDSIFAGQGITFTLYKNGSSIGTSNPVGEVIELGSGFYNYTYYTPGNANYSSATKQYNLTIIKYPSAVQLFFNGTQKGQLFVNETGANFTVIVDVSGRTVYLDANISGWVLQSDTTPLYNYTTLTADEYGTTYNITGYFIGDANYSSDSQTYYAKISESVGMLIVSLKTPESGTMTTVGQNRTFLVNATIECGGTLGSTCGEVNGTARYNSTSVVWWDESWSKRKEINITNAGSSTLTNFPAYINVSYVSDMQSNYDDLRFINGTCSQSSGTVELDYDIESYTGSNAHVWVRIPSLGVGVTSICMYYGNDGASPGESATETWEDNYVGVWHLTEDAGGTGSSDLYQDSTSQNNDGDDYVSSNGKKGMIGNGQEFDGSDDYISLGEPAILDFTSGDFTVAAWVNVTGGSGNHRPMVGKGDNQYMLKPYTDNTFEFCIYDGSWQCAYSDSALTENTWYHVVGRLEGTSVVIYVNGAEQTTTATTSGPSDSSYNVEIGRDNQNTDRVFPGVIDEVRISNTSRTGDWINQNYQIIANQGSYVSVGDEETYGTMVGINTTTGAEPFYTTNIQPQSCGDMAQGESCELNWIVNATGDVGSVWLMDVQFTSNKSSVANNDTADAEINITVDTRAPYWSNLGANNSYPIRGEQVKFYTYWDEDFNLKNWTFSWNATIDGSWTNVTSELFSGMGAWSNTTQQIPSFGNTTYGYRFYVIDEVGSENVTDIATFTVVGYLEVNITEPPSSLTVAQYQDFSVNVSVYCRDGFCGNVKGTVRYNATSPYPDTSISVAEGAQPFYVMETPALNSKLCPTSPLKENEFCNITWTLNASGSFINGWEIGALFNTSLSNIDENHTENSTITIIECFEEMTVAWEVLDFDNIIPSSAQNPAPGNPSNQYNISVNQWACDMDIWIKGTDFDNETLGSTMNVGNVTWNNQNQYSTSENLTKSFELINTGVPEMTNETTYYWLNAPAIYAGLYEGNITIKGNKTGG